jgi:hypothetical protein
VFHNWEKFDPNNVPFAETRDLTVFKNLQSNGNYIYHLLQQNETSHFLQAVYMHFLKLSQQISIISLHNIK